MTPLEEHTQGLSQGASAQEAQSRREPMSGDASDVDYSSAEYGDAESANAPVDASNASFVFQHAFPVGPPAAAPADGFDRPRADGGGIPRADGGGIPRADGGGGHAGAPAAMPASLGGNIIRTVFPPPLVCLPAALSGCLGASLPTALASL